MTGCTRPGCGGTIDEDGYCTDCGLKAQPAGRTPAAVAAGGATPVSQGSGSAAGSAGLAGGPCPRAGCDGTLDDEGYCSECGLKAPSQSTAGANARTAAKSGSGSRRGSGSGGSVTSGRTTSTSGRTSRRGSGGSRRFGAGLVELPPMPPRDPASALMANPEVPERQRFCSSCEKPVGRSRDGKPGRTQGFCRNCGTPFSFTPTLKPGDRIADEHYEVLGCIAHGGLGWIYLAVDHHVSDRWVVLKGLINSGDPDAVAAALSERQFLAQVEHPGIVKIYDFVQHPDPVSGIDVGYIVMEYVGGSSVRDVWREHRAAGNAASMPLEQAIAYVLEVLPALGYLHDHGLLYCDLKPDNVIHTAEQVKLLDLGGVRRVDDDDSAIYGTVGYQAPEIADAGPSIESDIYTVGRMLAVLTLNFPGFASTHAHELPHPGEAPLLAEFESYHRLLRRCTAPEPEDRFGSVAELQTQLVGVLREVLARREGTPRPAVSLSFGHEARVFGTDRPADGPVAAVPSPSEFAIALPVPRVDETDPGATFVSGITSSDPSQALASLALAPVGSPEVTLRQVRALVELGRFDEARASLDELPADPDAWRIAWYSGLIDLARGDVDAARLAFDHCFGMLPGEAAPRLALAACAELASQNDVAVGHYATVWATDRAYVSAAFGLSRARCALGDLANAIAALREVPETASLHRDAQLGAITALLRGSDARTLTYPELSDAGQRLGALRLDPTTRAEVAAELLTVTLERVELVDKGDLPPDPFAQRLTVLDHPLAERDLRFALESCYRDIAHHATTRELRISAVDRANAVRPRTWW